MKQVYQPQKHRLISPVFYFLLILPLFSFGPIFASDNNPSTQENKAVPVPYIQGFHCGGSKTFEMDDGAVYEGDREYMESNGAGRIGGWDESPGLLQALSDLGGLVPGVQSWNLLAYWVDGWEEYRFDLPDGTYLLSLHFSEWDNHWRGLRVFHVEAEGTPLLDSLDVFDHVDLQYAMNIRRVVNVEDGQLNITATPVEGVPSLAAIHVERIFPDETPPPKPYNLNATGGYAEVTLTWSATYEREQLGVLFARTDLTGGGPEEILTEHPIVATRYRDTGLEPYHEYSYRVVAVNSSYIMSDVAGPVTASPVQTDDSPLPVHEFEMSEENLQYLNTHRFTNDYMPASFWTQDQFWPDAGVRYRGNTTRSLVKKNHKIRLEEPLPDGHIKLNLQSEWNDPSVMREKMSYDVMTGSGCLSGNTEYVHLERNGEFIGVFLNVEQVDENFLDIRGRSGSIWKGVDGDFTKKQSLEGYYNAYSLEEGRYSDYEYLADIIEVVIDSPDGEFRTDILEHLDVERFLDYYSSQAIVSGWDFTSGNYYLFRDSETGMFEFVPWDLNETWSDAGQALDIGTRAHPILFFFWNRCFDRLMTTPQFRRMYAVRLEELLDDPFTLSNILYSMAELYNLLRPEMEKDPFKLGWESIAEFDNEAIKLATFAVNRRDEIFSQLETFEPDPTVNLFLNEAVQLNVEGEIDESGEHEPWLEIHNFGNERISLEGLWLSDDSSNIFEWQFPDDASVEPGDYTLVWLDGEPEEGPMHASFRLDPGEHILLLSREDGSLVDNLSLPGNIFPDIPIALIPDGAAYATLAAFATPLAGNDPVPVMDLSFSTDAEIFPEDTLSLSINVTNHSSSTYPLLLEIMWTTKWGGNLHDTLEVSADPYSTWSDTLRVGIPSDAPPLEITVTGKLFDDKEQTADLEEIRFWIRDPMAEFLVVNEVMADNDTTVMDESDQFDDWIEIYNPSSSRISLYGLYLSDDGENPRKWDFPDVSIDAGGHLVVWCDDDMDQGTLHTNFKLDADGEEVGIYDLDMRGNAPIDVVPFGSLGGDLAYGRSPDGAEKLAILPYATPGSSNPSWSIQRVFVP